MRFYILESYGDCTNKYGINLDKEYTVGEFIDTIFKDRPGEWGYIEVLDIETRSYSNGKFSNEGFSEDVLKMNIKKVVGHGGWSLMEYVIYT